MFANLDYKLLLFKSIGFPKSFLYFLSLYSTAMQNIRVGSSCWLRPQRHNFAVEIPTCWYLKTLKFTLPCTPTLKFVLSPMPTPNAYRWNIGGVGSQTRGAGVGHVDFMFFVSISSAFVSQREFSFQWNMGYSPFFSFSKSNSL